MYAGSLLPLTTYTIDNDSDDRRMGDYDDDGMIMIIVMFVM